MPSLKTAVLILAVAFLIFPISQAQAKPNLLTIAVFDFDVPANTQKTTVSVNTDQGSLEAEVKNIVRTNILTDKIITELVKSRRLSVVERSRLDEVMKEMDFSTSSGMTDPQQSMRVGKMLGAQLLLFGNFNNLEGYVRAKKVPYTNKVRRTGKISLGASIRIVSAETGKIVAAEQLLHQSVFKNMETGRLQGQQLQEALNGFVHKLVYLVLDEIFPVKVALSKANKVYLNRGKNGGISKGDIFKVVRRGEAIIDEDTGVKLGASQYDVGLIKIIVVESKMSIAVPYKLEEGETVQKGDVCKPSRKPKSVKRKKNKGPSVDDVFN